MIVNSKCKRKEVRGMKFQSLVNSIEMLEVVPGTAHSSAITNIDLFEELINQSTESK